MPEQRNDHFVQSLERGLAVIRSFGPDAPAQTIADVARRTGTSRPVVRRLLLTLVDLGYAVTDGKFFKLRPEVLELGFGYLSSLDVSNLGQVYLDELASRINETCSISVLEGSEIVYVARTQVRRVYNSDIRVGSRLPAYATSMGRVLLAALPPKERERILTKSSPQPLTPHTIVDRDELLAILQGVAEQGHAVVDQELGVGLRALAVPVRNRSGRVVAAMNISSQAWRETKEQMAEALPHLQKAADALSSKLIG